MSDNNYESHWGVTGLAIIDRSISPDNPTQYSDVLKLSLCADTLVERCHIEGGVEDCLDAVRGTNYTIRACTLSPNGKNGITLKGAIDGATIQDVVFDRHGSECDIELGQYDLYWSLGRHPTRNIIIQNVNSIDGGPIQVRIWNAETPKLITSNVKIKKVPKVIWLPYFLYRYLCVKILKKK